MTALDILEHFQKQAESELSELQTKCEGQAIQLKEVRAELGRLRTTVNETVRAANRYTQEMSVRLKSATDGEAKAKALYCKARDELERTAEELRTRAAQLDVPIRVLQADGFDLDGVNPYRVVRDLQRYMTAKTKALALFGGKDANT